MTRTTTTSSALDASITRQVWLLALTCLLVACVLPLPAPTRAGHEPAPVLDVVQPAAPALAGAPPGDCDDALVPDAFPHADALLAASTMSRARLKAEHFCLLYGCLPTVDLSWADPVR